MLIILGIPARTNEGNCLGLISESGGQLATISLHAEICSSEQCLEISPTPLCSGSSSSTKRKKHNMVIQKYKRSQRLAFSFFV